MGKEVAGRQWGRGGPSKGEGEGPNSRHSPEPALAPSSLRAAHASLRTTCGVFFSQVVRSVKSSTKQMFVEET